VGLNT